MHLISIPLIHTSFSWILIHNSIGCVHKTTDRIIHPTWIDISSVFLLAPDVEHTKQSISSPLSVFVLIFEPLRRESENQEQLNLSTHWYGTNPPSPPPFKKKPPIPQFSPKNQIQPGIGVDMGGRCRNEEKMDEWTKNRFTITQICIYTYNTPRKMEGK